MPPLCDFVSGVFVVTVSNGIIHRAQKAIQGDECVCTPTPPRVCVYYCRTCYKAVRRGGEEESGGHVL